MSDSTSILSINRTDRIFLIATAVGSVWVLSKVLRLVLRAAFPDKTPGVEDTSLLASSRPRTSSATTVKDLENVQEYDYIVVGTGTAGAVLASRLSEDPSISVLAIEAGLSDNKQPFSEIPAAFSRMYKSHTDWAVYTKPQKGNNGRRMFWPQGKMLGGCSSINAMIYNRGAPDDFNEWAKLGNEGWGYDDLLPYMKKAEGFIQSKEHPLPESELAQHGRNGPWAICYSWFTPVSQRFIDACVSVGFKKMTDLNSDEGTNGVARYQTHINENGQRASTARCYLTESVTSRPNLKIAVGQNVTRVLFDQSTSRPRAVGVEMISSTDATVKYLVKAKREVLLSAGAVKTPQLLKLSGVGPTPELKQHNIDLVKELPAVGANLVDHLLAPLVSKIPKDTSLHYLTSPLTSLGAILRWKRNGTGPLSSNMVQSAAFCRVASRPDAPAHLRNNDLTSGPNGSDIEILGCPVVFLEYGLHKAPKDDYFSVAAVHLRPQARGSVTLDSADPFTAPIVDPQYLSNQHDIDMLLYGLKMCRQIMKSQPFSSEFRGFYWPNNIENMSDSEMVEYIRNNSESLWHPMCSARMGRTDADSVIDTKLKVHGIDGLRVVDASAFPAPLAVHPVAPVVMLAERAADMLKKGL